MKINYIIDKYNHLKLFYGIGTSKYFFAVDLNNSIAYSFPEHNLYPLIKDLNLEKLKFESVNGAFNYATLIISGVLI